MTQSRRKVSMEYIGTLSELPLGEAIRVPLQPPIAVFRTEEDELFAIDDTCTHQDASLADGWVEDCKVECPLHESCFDLRTGAVDQPPAKLPVRAHTVHLEGEEIYVTLSTEKPNLPPGTQVGTTSVPSSAAAARDA
jgi:3-phenylpropionate/trans-cinnamate dioxygenase ferredoxin component